MAKIKSNFNMICDRKGERERAAKILVAAFIAAGATVERVDNDRRIYIRASIGPHGVSMSFDGGLKMSGWLTHWHGSREYSDSFMKAAQLYSRNEYHKCKCTGYYDIFGEMREKTVAGIQHLVKELMAEAQENIS